MKYTNCCKSVLAPVLKVSEIATGDYIGKKQSKALITLLIVLLIKTV